MVKASWDPRSLQADTYDAILKEVEEREGGHDGSSYLRWVFVVEHDGEEYVVGQNSSMNFSPKSRAYQFTEAILRRSPEKGEEIDFDTLAGKPCRLLIGFDSDRGYNNVEKVLAPRAVTK